LQGERKTLVLVGIGLAMVMHVVGVYWWYSKDSLWRPLVILPPQEIPRFWQAIFIIVVNGMAFTCLPSYEAAYLFNFVMKISILITFLRVYAN
jgi:hypothetical protein